MRFFVAVGLIIGGVAGISIGTSLNMPIATWAFFGFWTAVAVGILLRLFRPRRNYGPVQSTTIETADLIQDMYLGRKPPTMPPPDEETVEVGEPLPPHPPISKLRNSESRSKEEL